MIHHYLASAKWWANEQLLGYFLYWGFKHWPVIACLQKVYELHWIMTWLSFVSDKCLQSLDVTTLELFCQQYEWYDKIWMDVGCFGKDPCDWLVYLPTIHSGDEFCGKLVGKCTRLQLCLIYIFGSNATDGTIRRIKILVSRVCLWIRDICKDIIWASQNDTRENNINNYTNIHALRYYGVVLNWLFWVFLFLHFLFAPRK